MRFFKLGLLFFLFWETGFLWAEPGREHLPSVSLLHSPLLNINPCPDDEWRPLSSEEVKERKIKIGFKAVQYMGEWLDSKNLDLISEGLYQMADLIEKERKFEHWLKTHLNIDLDLSRDKGIIVYKFEW